MKIVYTYYLLTCVALCSIFSSCNNETDIYMENPDKRIQTKMQDILIYSQELPMDGLQK